MTEEKEKLLNISKAKIAKYGVISEQIASDMAKIGRYRLNVDICVALTGNAGPKVMENKPRGLYYLAIATPHDVQVIEILASGTRKQIRRACVKRALEELEITISKQVD
jgi:nicotinamide-nucleotide amidase